MDAWYLNNVICIGLSAIILVRMVSPPNHHLFVSGHCAALMIGFTPVRGVVTVEQADLLVLLLIIASLSLVGISVRQTRCDIVPGLLLCLASVIKLYRFAIVCFYAGRATLWSSEHSLTVL